MNHLKQCDKLLTQQIFWIPKAFATIVIQIFLLLANCSRKRGDIGIVFLSPDAGCNVNSKTCWLHFNRIPIKHINTISFRNRPVQLIYFEQALAVLWCPRYLLKALFNSRSPHLFQPRVIWSGISSKFCSNVKSGWMKTRENFVKHLEY